MPLKLLVAMSLAVAARRRDQAPEIATPAPAFAAYRFGVVPMKDAPINPSWILEGTPRARISSTSTGFDGTAGSAVWDCTAGTFRWQFDRDETVVILEGEVHVTTQDGDERVLAAGDIAYFRAGSSAVWRVDDYVRKVAFLRRPLPRIIATALKLKRTLTGGRQTSGLGH